MRQNECLLTAANVAHKALQLLCVVLMCLRSAISVGAQPLDGQDLGGLDTLKLGTPINICNFAQLRTDNGLSSNNINVIFKDNTGLMWIGTEDGLNSYDGYTIRRFLPSLHDTTSIFGKQIFDIRELDQNRIIIVMGDGGLNCYDKRTGKFSAQWGQQDSNDNNDEFASAFGMCMSNNSTYVLFPDCIQKYNNQNGQATRIQSARKMPRSGVKWGRVKMVGMPGSRGNIAMLSGSQALSVLSTKKDEMISVKNGRVYMYDLCPQDSSRLLIGTSNGVMCYNFETLEISDAIVLNGHEVHAIKQSRDKKFWVAYDGNRLGKWDPKSKTLSNIESNNDMMNPQTRVLDLFEDENGIVWVATSNSGLLKFDTKEPKITAHIIESALPRGYKTEDICAVSPTEVWAACGTAGMIRTNTETGESTPLAIPHHNVISVHRRSDKTLFIGTTKNLISYDSETNNMTTIYFSDSVAQAEGRVMVRNMNEDCLGNLWLATHVGLYRYNGISCERALMDDPANDVQEFNFVMEDSEGRIWAGAKSGAFVRNVDSKIFHRVGHIRTGRNNKGVLCVAERGNKILMGSANGVTVFDKTSLQETEASFNAEFSNCLVYSIACDDNGKIWLCTSAGIGYVDPDSGERQYVQRFDKNDGLYFIGNECHKFSKKQGRLYFGQASAINVIDTKSISFDLRMPKTFVPEVLYGQSGTEHAMPMKNDSTFFCKYAIGAATKIKVASSDYTQPSRNEFLYSIDGGEWTHLRYGSNEILLSGNLPGLYKVCLRASNSDRTWSYNVKTVYIDIAPPMWASRPALIMYAIFIMTVVWIMLNMRFRNINKRVRMAEEEAKSMNVIKAQRNRLAVINREQTDSINTAKRIQDALIPREDGGIEELFSKFFVFYRPKDIVSGDFYGVYQRGAKTFIIAADCTGHGVPGAFISILGIDHLYNIIMQQKVDDAGEILTKLHSELHDTVLRDLDDGMDMTICVVHHAEMKVNFAGAMNDLYIIRNNEVLTFRGDRRSIGTDDSWSEKAMARPKDFTSHTIECEPGDMMYMMSDGFADQHGGPEGKKFMARRLKNLLLNIHKLPAQDQKTLLNQTLNNWKGGHEQTDDVSVIGFEPWPE